MESCKEPTPEPGLSHLPFIYFQHQFLKSGRWANIKYVMCNNSCYGRCPYVGSLMRFSPEHCWHVLSHLWLAQFWIKMYYRE